MDSMITAAARALAMGDPLGALKRIALRNDAPALALRGIAMAQLGEFPKAKALLLRAARSFPPRERIARARCVVAEAEVALASRELGWPQRALDTARATLEEHGDRANAAHARYLQVRRLLLIGRVQEAEHELGGIDPSLPPALRAAHELVTAEIAMRQLRTKAARAALARAGRAAGEAQIPALSAEVERAGAALSVPTARRIAGGQERPLLLHEVESLFTSKALIVDACRNQLRQNGTVVSLAGRPVLFTIARALAVEWPGDVPRDELVYRAFGSAIADESHRVRLRVEIGRLRRAVRVFANVGATKRGFALEPRRAREVVVLAPPVEGEHTAVLAFLVDGEAWSSSALALALGTSQRTVQRALDALAIESRVQSFGRGRARRWTSPPVPGFTPTLLLPLALPGD